MLLPALVLGAALLALALRFYVTRGDESVDLRSPEARQRAAARWLVAGEGEEAERMLGQAVDLLSGWDKALALADLASFLAALSRDADAATALEEAVALGDSSPSAPSEELFELRVQMAQAYSRQGLIDKARAVLLRAIEEAAGELALGLAEEAYAEFQVRHGELSEALSRYERACRRLAEADHDRAPIALVRYAHALLLDEQSDCWRAMDALSDELQHAVPVALGHLSPSFEEELSTRLIDSLLQRIGSCAHWQEERESLRALARELGGTSAEAEQES